MSDFSDRRVPGLDLVRSAAILGVVVSHYWPFYERFSAAAPLKFLGTIGVELFFVLSGFLVGGILLRQAADLGDGKFGGFRFANSPSFWVRRWFRTLPNYVLFFLLFLLYDQPWVSGHWRAWGLSFFFLQNLFTDLSQGTFGIAWSLCVEEWLYLLLPLALAACTLRTKDSNRAALYSALILIVVPTVLRCFTAGKPWDLGIRHIVIYRLDAIAYGVLLAYLARYRRPVFDALAGDRWALVGITTLIGIWFHWYALGSVWVENGQAGSGFRWFVMSILFFPAMSLAIVPIVAWASRLATIPWGFKRLVYRTSLYSYSMYLGHEFVFYFVHPVLYARVSGLFGEFHGLTFIAAGLDLTAVYVFSAAVYHLWEAPMTRLRERFSSSPTATHISSTTELVASNG